MMTTPLPAADPRRASRFPVNHEALCETPSGREFRAQIVNISAHGCMIGGELAMEKGERVIIRLPKIGRIEAFLVWSQNGRCGFEFERIIRMPDFLELVETLK
jgi:hypothetical protein